MSDSDYSVIKSDVIKSFDCLTPKMIIFLLSNISFGHIKETPQRDVSFTHPKHVIINSY